MVEPEILILQTPATLLERQNMHDVGSTANRYFEAPMAQP
jgi:hypothetical protein